MGWTTDPPEARGQTRDRWESWQALVSQAEAHAAETAPDGGIRDLATFVDDLDRRASEQHAPVAEGVTLATFHAAKGLEWDSVFLVGLQDGTLPITYAQTEAAIEEERRLLYVGMTRARADLSLSWAQARNPGQAARRKPSRFLDPLLPDTERPAPRRSSRGVQTCVECGKPLAGAKGKRRCADCPAPYDEALFARLREWRLETSRSEEIAPFMVFSNATLEEIAERRPQSRAALKAISGVGPGKLEKYAEDLLVMLAD
jgi:DNA helicase-2/ATP-dependent DNA helicase PcrA